MKIRLEAGDFRIVSYEWGVAYAGMLLASQATGDPRFQDYAEKRLQFIAASVPFFRSTTEAHADWGTKLPLRNLLQPRALDDCGAMCAAMIKAKRNGQQSQSAAANRKPHQLHHDQRVSSRGWDPRTQPATAPDHLAR
jgi:rhamnogalacturonyl hydrolase YesR